MILKKNIHSIKIVFAMLSLVLILVNFIGMSYGVKPHEEIKFTTVHKTGLNYLNSTATEDFLREFNFGNLNKSKVQELNGLFAASIAPVAHHRSP